MTRLRRVARLGVEGISRKLDVRDITNNPKTGSTRFRRYLQPLREAWYLMDIREASFSFALRSHARQLAIPWVMGTNERIPTLWSDAVAVLEGKLASYRFADELGIPHATVLEVWGDAEQISIEPSIQRCVIKPNGSSSSKGAFVLDRDSHGGLINLITGAETDIQRIRDELHRLDAVEGVAPFLHEEFIEGPDGSVASEFNVFCFYGQVGLVQQLVLHDGVKWRKYYDSEFSPLPRMRDIPHCRDDLPVPRQTQDLLGMSRRLSAEIPLPFVRFDFFNGSRGYVLGEITTASGYGYYPREIDAKLGYLWENGMARLISDLLDGRTFDTFLDITGVSR